MQLSNHYTSCNWVSGGIEFRPDCLRVCCYAYLQSQEHENQTVLIDNYNGELIDWDNFFSLKNKLREDHKRNIYLDACKSCIYLHEKNWKDNNRITHITFNHWSRCNCNCSYCFTSHNKDECNAYKEYKLLPVLKDMAEKNILRFGNDGCIIFGGGEPTILDEFDEIINLCIDQGCKNIRINSSGIKYSESIARGLKLGVISLVISPDSGTKKTYEKIKQIKAHDIVWENIQKYSIAQDKNNLLKVKYIIIPDVNDNKKEIDNWLDMTIKNKAGAVSFSVEQAWYAKNNPNFPKKIYEIMKYIEKKAKKLDLDLEIYCEALSVLKEGQKNGK